MILIVLDAVDDAAKLRNELHQKTAVEHFI